MSEYTLLGYVSSGVTSYFGRKGDSVYNCLFMLANPFTCCGLSTLTNFGRMSVPAADVNEFLAGIYRLSYGKTHFVWVVNPQQHTAADHRALVNAGAIKVADFPNLQPGHGGYDLQMWMWNPNDGVGKYFNESGIALKEPVTPANPPAPGPQTSRTVKIKEPK